MRHPRTVVHNPGVAAIFVVFAVVLAVMTFTVLNVP